MEGLRVVTARIYVVADDGEEALSELLTTYASGLIDPDEREELLQSIYGVIIVDEQPAFPTDLDESIIIDDQTQRREP